MLQVETDSSGKRTFHAPACVLAVARELFPMADATSALFYLARRLSWYDAATLEQIALNQGVKAAIVFAQRRAERLAA